MYNGMIFGFLSCTSLQCNGLMVDAEQTDLKAQCNQIRKKWEIMKKEEH